MNDLKKYGIIIAMVLAVFVVNFNIATDDRGEVKPFRGAQLEDDVFYPLMAENFNKQTLTLFSDRGTFTNDKGDLYMDSDLHLMVSTDILSDVFSCNSSLYDKNRLVIKKFDKVITYSLDSSMIDLNGKNVSVTCPFTRYRGDYFVSVEDVASLLDYGYGFKNATLEANLTNKRAGEAFVPKNFDLREEQQAPTIRDQGTETTCWAYASVAAMESLLLPEEKLDFSVDSMVNYSAFDVSLEEGGEYTKALAYLLSWNGPVINDADGAVVRHLQEVQIPTYKNIDRIKEDVFLYGGVQTAIYGQDFGGDKPSPYYNASKNAYYYYGDKQPNHDVVIIGWDDSFSAGNFPTRPLADGAFICQNSWGRKFGEDGVFYVSYFDTNLCTQSVVYTKLESANNYDTIYQSDLCGWVGSIGFGQDSAFFANVFTAQEDGWIDAAGFYATGPNTYYEVYMITDYTGKSDLSKKGVKLGQGYLRDAGYYTIPFDHHMEVTKDSRFAIGVYIQTDSSVHPIAIEYAADAVTASCDITDGEGYISDDAVNWDRIEERAQANLCLKAYGSSW